MSRGLDERSDAGLELSVVLVTDTFTTIEKVVAALSIQGTPERLELVIVTPSPEEVRAEVSGMTAFGGIRVVPVESLRALEGPRGAGIRAASAPIVFVGETHAFPQPGWADALIEAHSAGWTVVVPGFENANPSSAMSWAGFLADYGSWLAGLPGGEITRFPTFNAAYRRSALLELGPRLDVLLSTGDELLQALRAAGGRFVFEPSARIAHLNIARRRDWIVERYLGGLVTAHSRMERWPRRRRLLYAAASPLIPVVLLARILPGLETARRTSLVPASAYPAVLAGLVVSAAGELVAYLGGSAEEATRRMGEYELHKCRYAQG
jgi:hypothetical protein